MSLRSLLLATVVTACAAVPPRPIGPLTELNGRVPGPPQACVVTNNSEALRPADNSGGQVLIYGAGRTIWVNRLGSCGFGSNDLMVIERMSSSLCRGDIIRSVDRLSHIPGPACILGDFTPFTRPPH